MLNNRKVLKSLHAGADKLARYCTSSQVKLDNVLILTKLTRFDYERMKFRNTSDEQFEKILRKRGTNYDKLKHHERLQKASVEKIANSLKEMGSNVRIVNRFSYDKSAVSWADCIVPAGGDGTFLLAASLVRNRQKPVVGINSDPNRSEGFLCLPKKYSIEPREALEKLRVGDFQWLFRSRIRTKMIGATRMEPKLLHQIPLYDVENIFGKEWETEESESNGSCKTLPVLALNEAFIGETLSAKVSHLEINFNNDLHYTNTKCSGVCICTGTGSTSWHYSINRLSVQNVAELLRLMDMDPTEGENSLATVYADIYNKNLIFSPEDKRMGFSIRDMISAGVWPDPKGLKSRDFPRRIVIKSHCEDAYIVIDGGLSFTFNDGTSAIFEINPEDDLRTVIMD